MTTRPDLVKQGLIDYLQSKSEVVAELPSADEIRESEYQSTEFSYPNVRLEGLMIPEENANCNRYSLDIQWNVFSEEASSAQANKIAGIISNVLHGKSFSQGGLQFSLTTTSINFAIRRDTRTWIATVRQRGLVSG